MNYEEMIERGTFFSTDINQILKLNDIAHSYAWLDRHSHIRAMVTITPIAR